MQRPVISFCHTPALARRVLACQRPPPGPLPLVEFHYCHAMRCFQRAALLRARRLSSAARVMVED